MPERSDDYEPTEADLDTVVEEATGKPVNPANLAAGITSMRQRIAQLEAEKTKLLERMEKDFDETLKDHLAAINGDIAIARERPAKCSRRTLLFPVRRWALDVKCSMFTGLPPPSSRQPQLN